MDIYLLLKSLHILGAILFIGNIVVTGWWKVMADRTRDPRIIAFAQRQVTLTDWVFTLGGSTLVTIAGVGNALWHGIDLTSNWILAGFGLFGISAAIWVCALIPLQTKLGRMAVNFSSGGSIPAEYWRYERQWLIYGFLATITPLAVVPVMVFKP